MIGAVQMFFGTNTNTYSSNEYPGGFEYIPKCLPQYLGVEDEPRCAHSFSTGFKLKPGHVIDSEPPKGKGCMVKDNVLFVST